MKSRTLGMLLGRIAPIFIGLAQVGAIAATGALAAACGDENDPKTWVKRLDDPAARTPAIKRLGQFFDDTMGRVNQKREDPQMKALLDVIIEPLTRQYTAGGLDEKTRKELMKSLSDMRDPRASAAFAKAFNEFEPGKNDEDVKFAAQSISGMVAAGTKIDQNLADALWSVFSKFRPSKSNSIQLVTAIHDAVVAVKSPTYGPKAVEKLAAPVDLKSVDSQMDQIQFWQLTSLQVIRDAKFAPAARAIVRVLLTPEKKDLWATAESILMNFPNEAEKLLISALDGSDPEFAKLAELFGDEKTQVYLTADALGWIGRPAGRDAVMKAFETVTTDKNRQALAITLVKFPADVRTFPVFKAQYEKFDPKTAADSRISLLQVASQFYDPTVTDWLVKEVATAKGDSAPEQQILGLQSAIKLMTVAQQKAVGDLVAKTDAQMVKIGAKAEQASAKALKELFDRASDALSKCRDDSSCYVGLLDEPVTGTTGKHIKAAWMSAELSTNKDATRQALVAKLDKVKSPAVRLAIVEAIDRLSPKGDEASAKALEKIIQSDETAGDKSVREVNGSVAKVALRLRARAL